MESKEASSCATWQDVLAGEKEKPYFTEMMAFLNREQAMGKTIYPPRPDIFNAIKSTPFDQVKVVIIGQDPYHGPGQANGLCFSVQNGVRLPPSLVNIFKEIKNDLGKPIPSSGDLDPWARQGVLLLNATLTVRASSPGSHQNKGWESFTDAVIR